MIYLAVIFILFALFIFQYNNDTLEIKRTIFWVSSFIFFGMFAFRGNNVGGDTIQYCAYYNGNFSTTYGSLSDLDSNIEIGFRVFCKLFNQILPGDFWFIFLSSLFSIVPFIWLCKKYASYPVLSYFYIFCSDYLMSVVNLQTNLRQNIAAGMIICAIYLALQGFKDVKRNIFILIFLAAAVFTHTSSYFLVPLLIILWFVPINKWVGIGLIIVSIVLNAFYIDSVEGYITSIIFSDFFSNEAFDNMTRYFDADSHYMMTGKAGKVIGLLAVSGWAMFNLAFAEKDEYNNIFMKSMMVGCAASNVAWSFPLAFRMVFLFQMLGTVYVPRKIRESKVLMTVNLLTLTLVLYHIYTLVTSTAALNADNHLLPYEFIWDNV